MTHREERDFLCLNWPLSFFLHDQRKNMRAGVGGGMLYYSSSLQHSFGGGVIDFDWGDQRNTPIVNFA